jgi:formylglycine-generating enzyme required for sulfatase activity/tRNA A-37 threonylcarbamoyl transferase component Bud32
MGSVYEAKQLSLERIIALKTIRRDYVADKGFLERFRREARAVGRFNTQHVVQIHDVGFDQGLHYIIMERVRGGNLRAYATSQPAGCLSVEDALRFLSQAARGLHEAEKLKIVHRDIKPGNLLVDDAGCVKITDFGIAKMLEGEGQVTMTATNEVLGTPLYMSPEQIEGGAIDHRSDMYSLGATFHHLLTGSPPVEGESVYEVIKRKSLMTSISPRRLLLQHAIPEGVSAVIERMTSLRAADRYPSFKDLLEDIERVQRGGMPAPAPERPADAARETPIDTVRTRMTGTGRMGPAEDGGRWPRTGVLAGAGVLVAAVAVAAIGWRAGWWHQGEPRKQDGSLTTGQVVVPEPPVVPSKTTRAGVSDPLPGKSKDTVTHVEEKKPPPAAVIADLRRDLDGFRTELEGSGPTAMLLENVKALRGRIPARAVGGGELEAEVDALVEDILEGQKRKDLLIGKPMETVEVAAPFEAVAAYWKEVSAILAPGAGAGKELRSWLDAERARRSAALEARVEPAVEAMASRAAAVKEQVARWEAPLDRLHAAEREIQASSARLAESFPAAAKRWEGKIAGALEGIASARESRASTQKRLDGLDGAAKAAGALVDGVKGPGDWTPELEKDVGARVAAASSALEALRAAEPRAPLDPVKVTLARVEERRAFWAAQRALLDEALSKLASRDSEGAAAALGRLEPGAQADALAARVAAARERLSSGFKAILERLDPEAAREDFQAAAEGLSGLGDAASHAMACAERAGKLADAAREMARVAGGDVQVSERNGRKRVGAFFIDRFEVSIEDYRSFVQAMAEARYEDVRALWPSEELFMRHRRGPECLRLPEADPRCPVEDVTYHEARAYLLWKGKDLPALEEWWLAAKGPLNGGVKHRINLPNERVPGSSVNRPVRVNDRGLARAFPRGDPVHHLSGNVAEWVKVRDASARDSLLIGGRYTDTNEKKFTGEAPDRLPLSESRAGYGFRGVLRPADFFADLLPAASR